MTPIDLSKPVQTRRGEPVEILIKDSGDPFKPVVGVVLTHFGPKRLLAWDTHGRRQPLPPPGYPRARLTALDLVNVPPPEVVRYSRLSGDPENGGVKLGLWLKRPPKRLPTDTGVLKLTCVDGVPTKAEIV